MTLEHLSRQQLIRKIELDEDSVRRARQLLKDLQDLQNKVRELESRPHQVKEVIREVPYEVVKEVEVIKEVLPSWVNEDDLKVFIKVRGAL